MSFFLCLNNATLCSCSQDLKWLDHVGGLNVAVGTKRHVFSVRKGGGGGGGGAGRKKKG